MDTAKTNKPKQKSNAIKIVLIVLGTFGLFIILICIVFQYLSPYLPKVYDENGKPILQKVETNEVIYFYPSNFTKQIDHDHILKLVSLGGPEDSVTAIIFDSSDSTSPDEIAICNWEEDSLIDLFAQKLKVKTSNIKNFQLNNIDGKLIGCNMSFEVNGDDDFFVNSYFEKKTGALKYYSYVITTDSVKSPDYLAAVKSATLLEIK